MSLRLTYAEENSFLSLPHFRGSLYSIILLVSQRAHATLWQNSNLFVWVQLVACELSDVKDFFPRWKSFCVLSKRRERERNYIVARGNRRQNESEISLALAKLRQRKWLLKTMTYCIKEKSFFTFALFIISSSNSTLL